jgi:hypothetical protein
MIFRMNHHRASAFCLRMIFSENRCTLFRIMREQFNLSPIARDAACARFGLSPLKKGAHV